MHIFGRNWGDVSARKFPHSSSIAYNKLSMLIQLLACHPANFIGENTTMRGSDTFSSNIRSILPWVSLSLGIPSGCLPQIYPFSISMCQKCTISHYIINDKKRQRKMGRICCSIPQSSIWCICRFPMISLENLWGLPLKSTSALSPMIHQNPYKFYRESLENPLGIHMKNSLQFPRGFLFHLPPKFPRGFLSTKYPPSAGFPAVSAWFRPSGVLF